jgi:hypothetical protein
VAAGLGAVAAIIYGAALLVRETRLAVQNISQRIARVQRRAILQEATSAGKHQV